MKFESSKKFASSQVQIWNLEVRSSSSLKSLFATQVSADGQQLEHVAKLAQYAEESPTKVQIFYLCLKVLRARSRLYQRNSKPTLQVTTFCILLHSFLRFTSFTHVCTASKIKILASIENIFANIWHEFVNICRHWSLFANFRPSFGDIFGKVLSNFCSVLTVHLYATRVHHISLYDIPYTLYFITTF